MKQSYYYQGLGSTLSQSVVSLFHPSFKEGETSETREGGLLAKVLWVVSTEDDLIDISPRTLEILIYLVGWK